MSLDLYRATPRQTRRFIVEAITAGLVPFVQSSPGMGKSSLVKSIAKEHNLKVIDHRLSTSAPEDLTGLPRFTPDGKASFAPFADLFPLEGDSLPLVNPRAKEGDKDFGVSYDGWLLFLDEFNSAPKSVQAAAYKLVLDRQVGQHNLHENVVLVAAGNLASDRAITNNLSTAMQSRVVHIEMKIDHRSWLEDVAIKQNYDPRIISFLSQYPSKLMDFVPEHTEKTFCCPRSWEFVNSLIKGKGRLDDEMAILLAGTITSGTAVEFVKYSQIFQSLVRIDDILADPDKVDVPSDISVMWATVSMMQEHITAKNMDKLAKYADRFSMDFRVLFYRSAIIRNPELRSNPAFLGAMATLARYLHDS